MQEQTGMTLNLKAGSSGSPCSPILGAEIGEVDAESAPEGSLGSSRLVAYRERRSFR